MTESVEDLAAWLGRIWDEEEEQAAATGQPDGFYPDPHDLGSPMRHESVLARIAADRKILAMHTGPHECPYWDGNGEYWEDLYCRTVLLLASPYESRPGFRPEWLVERQGVEQ